SLRDSKQNLIEYPVVIIPQHFSYSFSDHRRYDLANAALQIAVVGDGRAHRDFGGARRRNTIRNELRGINQQTRRDTFFQSVTAQVAHLLSNQDEVARRAFIDAALASNDRGF